jgi:hypothetical protein
VLGPRHFLAGCSLSQEDTGPNFPSPAREGGMAFVGEGDVDDDPVADTAVEAGHHAAVVGGRGRQRIVQKAGATMPCLRLDVG